jgi:uncharacterized tellurite resistance protein B-like protein
MVKAKAIIPDMSLLDLIYSKTGISESQNLIASLLALVAKSDGGISLDESERMVGLLRNRFRVSPIEALEMITRASHELAVHSRLDEVMDAINQKLTLAQKEDLMLMVLHVIAADSRKDAGEMMLLAAVVEGLRMPDRRMDKVYERYFKEQQE